ncbi:MAG: hypothetical protein AAFR83_25005 [Cyanobacteria bacterium J06629_18]
MSDIKPLLESYSGYTSESAKLLKTQDGVLGAGGSSLKDERDLINLSVGESIETRISEIGPPTRFYNLSGTETISKIDAKKLAYLARALQLNRFDPTNPRMQEEQREFKAQYETFVEEAGVDDLDIEPFLK